MPRPHGRMGGNPVTNVHPIRRPDAVDTAKQFAAELDTPGRRPALRWTAKCFGRSRFRRAAVYDGLAVTLLMALMTCLGVVLFAASAKADGVIDDDEQVYADAYGGAICQVLDEHYSLAGVVGIYDVIVEQGYAPDSAVDIINVAVHEHCPDNWRLLVAIGRAARAGA